MRLPFQSIAKNDIWYDSRLSAVLGVLLYISAFQFQSLRYQSLTMSSLASSSASSSSVGRAMGRLALAPGDSPMVKGEGRGRDEIRGPSGRSRSEGGVRLTRKRKLDEGEVEDDWEKGKCGKCGEVLWVIVKHKAVQMEMGRRCKCRQINRAKITRQKRREAAGLAVNFLGCAQSLSKVFDAFVIQLSFFGPKYI